MIVIVNSVVFTVLEYPSSRVSAAIWQASGTTMIAAERVGRRARLIEIDPLYCDATVLRWQNLTGKTARLAGSGETFDEVKARRDAELK